MPLSLSRTTTDIARGTDAAARLLTKSRVGTDSAAGTDGAVGHVARPVTVADAAAGVDVAVATLISDIWRPMLSAGKDFFVACRTPSGKHDSADGYAGMQLWRFNPDGSAATQVMTVPSLVSDSWTSYGHPEWSKDDSFMVIWVQTSTGSQIVKLDGGNFTVLGVLRIVASPDLLTDPSYSPDGSTVVFVDRVAGTYDIAMMSAANGLGYHILVASANPLADPYFSPDGTLVAYAEMTGVVDGDHPLGQWSLKWVDVAGGAPNQFWNDTNVNVHPFWLNSTEVLFQTFRYGIDTLSQIARVAIDGSQYMVVGPGEYPRVMVV